ncbi:hypothetical protein pb186bvf_011991 [Paramecium bursaria]
MQLVEKVKVAVRLRPFIEEELMSKDKSVCIDSLDQNKNMIISKHQDQKKVKKDFEKRQFLFDAVFDPKANQQTIYNEVGRSVVDSVIKGFNGTIFCYGQTGTGKTYTMMGGPDDQGIIPRSLEHIFTEIHKDVNTQYSIQIGYMQIYMEMILDLVRPDNQDIKIRECPDQGVFLSGLEWVDVENTQECLQLLAFAEKNRVVAFTNLNAHSSRSHTMLMVRVERKQNKILKSKQLTLSTEYEDDAIGTLYLVDLAGSERVKKSRATGDRLSEARSINYSLTALGKCIHALTGPKQTFVPFRDSKLTRILQDSLGGNCKTALIVNIGPAGRHVEETLSSLIFGMRAMKVQNTPHLNLQRGNSEGSSLLQQEIDMKDEIIQKLEKNQMKLQSQVSMLQKEVSELKNNGSTLIEDDSYKLKLEKMEEEHKAFLEEIDSMMVEQEQENEELKKQLTSLQQKYVESEKQLEIIRNQNNELHITVHDLHQLVDQKEKELLAKCQESNYRSNKSLDIINKNREKQTQSWRQELQQLTGQYANLLEEKKRVEFNNSIKENYVEINYKVEEQQSQIIKLSQENENYKQQTIKYQQLNKELLHKLAEYEETIEKFNIEAAQQDKLNNELSKRMEQYESTLKEQQDNEYLLIMEIDQKEKHIQEIQSEYREIQQQIELIKGQYTTIQQMNTHKVKQLTQEIQGLVQKNTDLQAMIQDMKKTKLDFHSQQSHTKEQNFDLEMKKSITVSGVNEGQILVEMQMKFNELEEEYTQRLRSKDKYIQEIENQLNQKSKDLNESTQEIDQLRFQLDKFSKRSQQSLSRMEEVMNYEVVRSILEKIVLQVEINLLDQEDINSSLPQSDLKMYTRSFSKQEGTQMVESLFINSRRSNNLPIVECENEDSDESKPNFISNSASNQFRKQQSRQDSVFSFSEKQQKKEFTSLYEDDLSDIHQQSARGSSNDDISFQINFNDAHAVEKFMHQIKQRQLTLIQPDLSVGSIQQATSPKVNEQSEQKKQQVEELYQVIRAMAHHIVEKNQSDQQTAKQLFKSTLTDFNGMCNTLTQYFL